MRFFATLYSIVFASAALWAWITYFEYRHLNVDHSLPGFVLFFITLPSSQLLDIFTPWNSRLMNNEIAMLSLVTAIGFVQVLLVWLMVKWLLARWSAR